MKSHPEATGARRAAEIHGLSAWCIAAAFGAYFCMYGFRRPFTAAGYDQLTPWGAGYKTALVVAQVAGYMLAKFIGIRVVSGMRPGRRAWAILSLAGAAQVALLAFALLPPPWNLAAMFLNGLSLGMVFGLVLGFLEGRRTTEALTAGLCASFILADGVTKSTGAWLLAMGVGPFQMPAAAGFLYALPLLFFVWMLTRIPQPTPADIAARRERAPMSGADRMALLRECGAGLYLLTGVYLLLTILRSLRADFAPELWQGLGQAPLAVDFTRTEVLVTAGVIVLNGMAVLITDHQRTFFFAMALSISGFALTGLAAAGLSGGRLGGFGFMTLSGLGLYLPYVALHTTIFERLISMTGARGNLGFLLYFADSFGYLGYAGVMLVRVALPPGEGFLGFFLDFSRIVTLLSIIMLFCCLVWFGRRGQPAAAGTSQLAVD
ncbi:MAG: DUF5690 family protein [Blastocatellia bacterium]